MATEIYEHYLDQILRIQSLSQVKGKILQRLWQADEVPFPKPWVASAELLALTGQKYFDRRARELRDQLGCDLETDYREELGGHAWRLRSPQLSPPQPRNYLNTTQKRKLFEQYDHRCVICGMQATPGLRGLQSDHRVPLSRGGSHAWDNWQTLCTACNVGKRRACAGCDLDCQLCPWAFPDRVGIPLWTTLPEPLIYNLDRYATQHQKTRSEIIEEAIRRYLDF